jgi:hypothetical protein
VPPFIVAEIVEVVVPSTTLLVTVKVAVVAPAVTVTVAGTVAAAVLLLESVTRRWVVEPAAGAFSVIVAVEFATPPTTVVGFKVIDATCGGLSVSVAVFVTPLRVAVMVTVVAAPTETLVTVNVALVAPAGTVTLAGVVVDALLSDNVTAAPPVGAGPSSVTVPVEEVPPVTVAGLMDTLVRAGALIVRVAVRVTPL